MREYYRWRDKKNSGVALVLLLLTSACGTEPTVATYEPPVEIKLPQVDAAFQEYVGRFAYEGLRRGVRFSLDNLTVVGKEALTEADKYPKAVGVCYRSKARAVIEIKMPFWHNANEVERERTIFHELGHCILGRIHREIEIDTPSGKYFGSIMEPRLFDGYPELRDYYNDELFGIL